MLYDTHCHIDLAKDKDKINIIKTFKINHPEGFLNIIGTNLTSSKISLDIAKKYNFIYSSIGIHPSDINKYSNLEDIILELETLYLENIQKVIGIGECGLDYFHIDKKNIINDKNIQKEYFKAQILLAKKYNLPVIIHNREAKEDILQILKEINYKNFVFHCWSENLEFAKKILLFAPNCKISFSGIVTFKNAKDIQDVAKNIPLLNILVETDSPYLTPTPFRGKEENEPDFTKYILDYICELRDEETDIIKKQIFENSTEFFGFKK